MARGTSAEMRMRISDAAVALFRDRGFARTSVRDIASSVGVDPSLVIRHFGSKESLFLEIMHPLHDEQPLLATPLEELGTRLIELVLADEHAIRGDYLALVRGSNEPAIAERLRGVHERMFVEPLLVRLTGEDAQLRARLAAALVGGLLYALWVVGDEQLLATDHREIAERYGALLQTIITPPN